MTRTSAQRGEIISGERDTFPEEEEITTQLARNADEQMNIGLFTKH